MKLSRVFRSIRRGGMPPWFDYDKVRLGRVSDCVGDASPRHRVMGERLAIAHMLRDKQAGRHNRAATWLQLAGVLGLERVGLGF